MQINRCYLHYKQAQCLLGEAKYVGGKQGRETVIKQVFIGGKSSEATLVFLLNFTYSVESKCNCT